MSSTAQRAETRIYSQQFDQITAHYDRDVAIAANYGWAAPASRRTSWGLTAAPRFRILISCLSTIGARISAC